MATVFRDPLISTPRSPSKPGPTIASVGLAGLLAVAGAKPFVQNDWPVPRTTVYPTQNRTFLHPAQTRLIGQDTFFGSKGLSPNYDWPLPRSAVYPPQTRTWTLAAQIQLIGKDTFFGGFGKAPTYDWPLPKVKPYPIANRTWLQSYDWANLGKDTFFGGPGDAPDYDWPLPRTASYPLANRAGISGRVIAPIFPFVQSDWPLPGTHRWDFRQGEVSGRALGPGAMPFGQTDWPLPAAKQQGKTWTWTQQLAQPQAPFSAASWPRPTAAPYQVVNVGQNLLALYQIMAAAPFSQTDWPLPKATKQAPQDVPQNYLVGLASQGLAPFTPQDWPLPKKPSFVLGEVSGRAIGVTAAQAPFSQLDWPTPRRIKFQGVQDISGLLSSPIIDVLPMPFRSAFSLSRQLQFRVAEISQSLLALYQPAAVVAPFTQSEWPLPRKKPFVLGVTSGRAIGLPVVQAPFTQFDWPNPKQIGAAARTWTWNTLLPPQIQIAVPFAQTDWPLTKKIFFKQGEVSGRAIGVTVTATPVSQPDWPLPSKPPFSLPFWYTVRYEIEPGPFQQFDWPLPKVTKFTQADVNGITILLPSPPAPIAQYNWPLAHAAVYSTQTRTWTFVPIVIPPAIIVPPAPVIQEAPGLGGAKARKKVRGPYSDPTIYEAYIDRCIAEREKPRINVETAVLKEALVTEVETRRQTGYAEYDALVRENQLLERLINRETPKYVRAIAARQRQIDLQIKTLEENEISSIIIFLDDM